MVNLREDDFYTEIGMRRLAATIIYTAIEDWREVAPCNLILVLPEGEEFKVTKEELLEFFNSDWFDGLTEIIGLHPDRLLHKLLNEPSDRPYWKRKHRAKRRAKRL